MVGVGGQFWHPSAVCVSDQWDWGMGAMEGKFMISTCCHGNLEQSTFCERHAINPLTVHKLFPFLVCFRRRLIRVTCLLTRPRVS